MKDFYRLTQAILASTGILYGSAGFIAVARAHDAMPTAANPLGWQYGIACCSNFDCRQLNDDEVAETSTGYLIKATGEEIAYSDKRIKQSKDEYYHQCTPGGKVDAPRSICLYVPDRGF